MKKEKLIELGVSEEIAGKVLELHNGAVKELEGQVTKLDCTGHRKEIRGN